MGIENTGTVSSPITPAQTSLLGEKAKRGLPPASAGAPGSGRGWTVERIHSRYAELEKINVRLNAAAKMHADRDRAMGRADEYLERMKADLAHILKQFPPYPPESEERIRALRSYAGFRNLIDRLTLPPPENLLAEARQGPAAEEASVKEHADFHDPVGFSGQRIETPVAS